MLAVVLNLVQALEPVQAWCSYCVEMSCNGIMLITSLLAATLVRNYRSHQSLLQLPNKLFYDNQLKAAADQIETRPPKWSLSTSETQVGVEYI